MKILDSSSYIKLMWLPELDESILWIKNETKFYDSDIIKKITGFLDLNSWHREFGILHRKWLNDESQELNNIKNDIHLRAIYKIEDLNKEIEDLKLFYWFDIDRSIQKNENYVWNKCPISQLSLIELHNVHPNNKFISPKFPIVFPE